MIYWTAISYHRFISSISEVFLRRLSTIFVFRFGRPSSVGDNYVERCLAERGVVGNREHWHKETYAHNRIMNDVGHATPHVSRASQFRCVLSNGQPVEFIIPAKNTLYSNVLYFLNDLLEIYRQPWNKLWTR